MTIPAPPPDAPIRFPNQLVSYGAKPWIDPIFATQTTWWIDGSNRTGHASDVNDGKTAATPLRTDVERARRVGGNPVSVTMTVNVMSDLEDGDYVTEPFVTKDGLFFVDGATGPTILGGGTVTGYAAQVGDVPAEITDSTQSFTGLVDYRFRITEGVTDGIICPIVASVSTHVAVVPDPETLTTDPTQFQLDSSTPTVGDAYVVERCPRVHSIVSPYGLQQGQPELAGGKFTLLMYASVNFDQRQIIGTLTAQGYSRQFVGCQFSNAPNPGNGQFFCCGFTANGGLMEVFAGTAAVFLGCGFNLSAEGGTSLVVDSGAVAVVDQNTLLWGGAPTSSNVGGACRVNGFLGVGQSQTGTYVGNGAGVCASQGNGITVTPGGVAVARYPLWGGGTGVTNAGFGVVTQNGGQLSYYTKPSLTGVGGAASVGGTTKAWGAIPFINTANNAAIVAVAPTPV